MASLQIKFIKKEEIIEALLNTIYTILKTTTLSQGDFSMGNMIAAHSDALTSSPTNHKTKGEDGLSQVAL